MKGIRFARAIGGYRMVFGRMCAVLLILRARAMTLFFLRAVGAILESRDGEQRNLF